MTVSIFAVVVLAALLTAGAVQVCRSRMSGGIAAIATGVLLLTAMVFATALTHTYETASQVTFVYPHLMLEAERDIARFELGAGVVGAAYVLVCFGAFAASYTATSKVLLRSKSVTGQNIHYFFIKLSDVRPLFLVGTAFGLFILDMALQMHDLRVSADYYSMYLLTSSLMVIALFTAALTHQWVAPRQDAQSMPAVVADEIEVSPV